MGIFMRFSKLFFPVVLATALGFGLVTGASASTILNGDFSSGTTVPTSWTEEFCQSTCGPDNGDFGNVVSGRMEMKAPTFFLGISVLEIRQSVNVMAASALLSFEAAVLSVVTETPGTGGAVIGDWFGMAFVDAGGTNHTSFFMDATQAILHPSNPNPGGSSITAGGLGKIFSMDLSAYAGTTIDLIFKVVSNDDRAVTTFGLDNVAFSATGTGTGSSGSGTIGAVPLPAGLILMLTGPAALALFRRRRRV